jgi:O-antigen ligase
MQPESFIQRIRTQKDSRNILGTLGAVVVAFIIGRQIVAGSFFPLVLLVAFAIVVLIFFRRDSFLYLLPGILLLPNFGLDIPGPWAITVEDAFLLALFTGYLARCIIQGHPIFPRKDPIVFAYGLFLVIAAISLFKSVSVGAGTVLINLKDLMRMVELFMLYLVAVDVLDSVPKVLKLVRNFLFISLIYVGVSYYIYFTQSPFFYSVLTMQPAYIYLYPNIILRMISIAGSTSQTGMFFAVILALAAFYPALNKSRMRRILRILLVVPVALCIFLSFNRGTWAGLSLGGFMLLLNGSVNWKKALTAGVLLVAIVLLGVISVFGQSDMEVTAFKALDISKKAGHDRWIRWVGAVDLMLDHPLLGVGYNNYAWVYGDYSIKEGDVQQYGSPHNMFVDIMTGTGLLGFGVFFALLILIGKTMRKNLTSINEEIRKISIGIYFAFFTFLGASMFDSFFFKPHHTAILIVTTWAMATALSHVSDDDPIPDSPDGA